MSLTLYHHGSSACAAKVRFALAEKGLPWESRYVDILKGEQFEPAFLALNPKAVVPVLVHDGTVLTESTVICEYVEEALCESTCRTRDGKALGRRPPVTRRRVVRTRAPAAHVPPRARRMVTAGARERHARETASGRGPRSPNCSASPDARTRHLSWQINLAFETDPKSGLQ